jgi:hypothetical protein
MKYILKVLFVILALVLYFLAVLMTVYKSPSGMNDMYGYVCITFGPLSIAYGVPPFLAWLANFPFFACVVMNIIGRAYKTCASLAISAFLLSFFSLFVNKLLVNEIGTEEPVTPGPGLVLWILSIFFVLVASLIPAVRKKAA